MFPFSRDFLCFDYSFQRFSRSFNQSFLKAISKLSKRKIYLSLRQNIFSLKANNIYP